MSCHRIDGAFQSNEVNIGWRLGQARLLTEIRTKPGGGELVGHLDTTDGCGIQTVRNPVRLPAPPTRPPLHGADHDTHIWVYARNGSDTGWVREQDIAHEPVNLAKPPLRGPAGRDFEVGRTLPAMKPPSGCGKLSVTNQSRSSTCGRPIFGTRRTARASTICTAAITSRYSSSTPRKAFISSRCCTQTQTARRPRARAPGSSPKRSPEPTRGVHPA